MSDRSATWIEIGGAISRPLISKLGTAAVEEGVGLEWDAGADHEEIIEACLNACVEKTALNLYDNECSGGQFEGLEAFCRGAGLAYRRADDGHYAYPACWSGWRPGLPHTMEGLGTIETGPAIPLAEIKQFHAGGGALSMLLFQYKALSEPVKPLRLVDNAAAGE